MQSSVRKKLTEALLKDLSSKENRKLRKLPRKYETNKIESKQLYV